jgi:hypothetical protein
MTYLFEVLHPVLARKVDPRNGYDIEVPKT